MCRQHHSSALKTNLQEVFVDTSGFSESRTEDFSTAISFDGGEFDTGMYDYRLKVTSNFNGGSRRSNFVDGTVMVVNEEQSPFGAGWMLSGLFDLAFNEDDSVTLVAPNGRSLNYLPNTATGAAPDTFISPRNDYAVFIRNADGSTTHTEKDGIKMHFNTTGQLTTRVDRNNNTTAYAYDAPGDQGGKLTTITDPVGLITNFAYDNNGLLDTVTDPAGRVSTFTFDATGNLTQITYPDTTFETFEYDGRHLMTAHEDERQNRSTDRYDAFGRVIDGTLPDGTVRSAIGQSATALVDVSSGIGTAANPTPVVRSADVDGEYTDGRGNRSRKVLDAHARSTLEVDEVGRVTTHIRDADSNATQTTRPIGSIVNRTFDTFGNVLTSTEAFNAATTTTTYDNFSLVTSTTNPRNNTTSINRDPANGNPISIVNALGHTTAMQYDNRGLVTQTTEPNGLVTTFTYNAEGLLDTKTETPPTGSPGNVRVWTYSYFATGLKQTVTTPDGITLNYQYDPRNTLLSVTDNLNQTVTYTYDNYKNVIKTETNNADGTLALQTDNTYDNRNRLTQSSAPHDAAEVSITQQLLDANSNPIGNIDPNGNASSTGYDAFNRVDTNTHRENGITQTTYDAQDRIIKVTAPNGVETNYEYDIINRKTKEISSDRGTTTYTYDLANNLTSMTEGRGITTTLTYDSLERPTTKTYPNTIAGKVEDVAYAYDTCAFGIGYLCNRTDESGQTAYEYDAYGNLTSQTWAETQGIVYSTRYEYDNGDNISQMTYPGGRTITYTRDGVRRITAIDTTLNGTAQNIINNTQYRADNQITQCTTGNGLSDTRTYDLQGRLTQQLLTNPTGNQIIDDRSYSYDKNSNILAIDTNVEDNAYQYDKRDRLTNDTIDAGIPTNFGYDLNDNRASDIKPDASGNYDEQYIYGATSNRLNSQDAIQIGTTAIPEVKNRDLIYNNVGRLFQLFEESTKKADYIYNDGGVPSARPKQIA